ncbi:MAG: glycosyltransferase family 4 protein, partial [Gammaproteobacteria bacterium]|nr:glycosyltransferase family 4 protein [Gammaproteobacteria bacterium]
MTIVVIWSRFGPYHLARLHGLATYTENSGVSVVGLEVAQRDHYAWNVHAGANSFRRNTLFPQRDYDSLSRFEIQFAVTRALDKLRPNAVAVNGWSVPEARAAMGWCRRNGIATVLMSETKEDDGSGKRAWWKETIKGRLVRRYNAALVGGHRQADYLVKFGFPRNRIFTGYDVVDNDYFARGAARARSDLEKLRNQYRLPKRYFFACTRFLPRKNLDGLLRAYAVYRKTCTNIPWSLVIAGAGEEERGLRQLAAQLNVPDLHWAGFLQYEQLPVFFGLASAFIHPALAEPWGLVVNEAAASGLPLLVAHPVGARYELLAEDEIGLIFDPKDVTDMARALRKMADMSD